MSSSWLSSTPGRWLRPCSRRRETVLATALLLSAAVVVFSPHVAHGGFYADDWYNALSYRSRGYADAAVSAWRDSLHWRPGLAFLLPVPHALFGSEPAYHLSAAVALAVLASLGFFAFLRALGFELPHALALALLSLVFPWSDTVRLWATASLNNVAIVAYFAGFATALHALRTGSPRRARTLGLHAVAGGLYLLSLLTYEVAAPAILLSGLLYQIRAPWSVVRHRWLLDASLVLVSFAVFVLPASETRRLGSFRERFADIPDFGVQASSLFASTFLPPGASSSTAKVLVLAAATVVVAAALRAARGADGDDLAKWLRRTGGGLGVVALGYVTFLGYGFYPLSEGLANRVNTFSAFGYVVATYSLLALLAGLVARGRARWSAAVLAAGCLVVAGVFTQRVRDDIALYDSAAAEQSAQLAQLRELAGGAEGTIVTFGHRASVAPGVYTAFGAAWVATSAVRLLWNETSVTVVPATTSGVACAGQTVRIAPQSETPYAAPYGRIIFVDLSSRTVRRAASRRECLEALASVDRHRGRSDAATAAGNRRHGPTQGEVEAHRRERGAVRADDEAGLNDGLALPFVLLGLLIAEESGTD